MVVLLLESSMAFVGVPPLAKKAPPPRGGGFRKLGEAGFFVDSEAALLASNQGFQVAPLPVVSCAFVFGTFGWLQFKIVKFREASSAVEKAREAFTKAKVRQITASGAEDEVFLATVVLEQARMDLEEARYVQMGPFLFCIDAEETREEEEVLPEEVLPAMDEDEALKKRLRVVLFLSNFLLLGVACALITPTDPMLVDTNTDKATADLLYNRSPDSIPTDNQEARQKFTRNADHRFNRKRGLGDFALPSTYDWYLEE